MTTVAGMDVAARSPVWPWAARLHFRQGEAIFAQDEAADMVYRLVHGVARTSHILPDGRRQVGDFYFEGDLIGIEAEARHRFSAEALADSEVLVLRREGSAAYDARMVERAIWRATTEELRRVQAHLLLLGRATASQKVAGFLLQFAERLRSQVVVLPMNRQDMADYLGLTVETISRVLSRLQSEGLVEFLDARRYRILRPRRLSELAAD